jgi:hypothetical protein
MGGNFSHGHTEISNEVSDEEPQTFDKYHCISVMIDIKNISLCSESFLFMGFMWTAGSSCLIT